MEMEMVKRMKLNIFPLAVLMLAPEDGGEPDLAEAIMAANRADLEWLGWDGGVPKWHPLKDESVRRSAPLRLRADYSA